MILKRIIHVMIVVPFGCEFSVVVMWNFLVVCWNPSTEDYKTKMEVVSRNFYHFTFQPKVKSQRDQFGKIDNQIISREDTCF